MDRNQPKPRRQSDVGEHFQRSAFIVQQSSGTPSKTLTTQSWQPDPAQRSRRSRSSPCPCRALIVCHSAVLCSVSTARYRQAPTTDVLRRAQPQPHGTVGGVPYRQRMGQLSFADVCGHSPRKLGPPACGLARHVRLAARDHLRRRRPGDHRRAGASRRRATTRSPRSARSRCAAARCWVNSPHWSIRAASIPPQIVALTGITTAMVYDAPADRLGVAGVPRVLPRRGAGRPQRRLRHRVPARGRRTLPASPGRGRRCCARSGWPAGCSPATRPPACGCRRWRGCSARPPHRRTARSTMPAPPSTCCTR